jgi:hypothetical protein
MDAARAGTLRQDPEMSERVDAFVARFGRLQDTLGDKLLPRLLQWLAEPVGARPSTTSPRQSVWA